MSSNIYPSNFRPANVTTFLSSYLAEKLSLPDIQGTEIELRLGGFVSKNSKSILPFIDKLSYQSPLMINHNLKHKDSGILASFTRPFEQESFNFDPSIDANTFFVKKAALDKYVPPENRTEALTIDFLMGGERYQWEVNDKQFFMNSKSNKENIDMINMGIHMRMSTAKEMKVIIDYQDFYQKFSFKNISLLRIKFRSNYDFQFIRFSLTKTYQVKHGDVFKYLFDELISQMNKNFEETDVAAIIIRLFKVINHYKLKHQYEIEAEIIDNMFLQGFIKANNINGFNACVDRFFRNFIIMSALSESFQWTEYERLLKENGKPVVLPIIGKYLETINGKNG